MNKPHMLPRQPRVAVLVPASTGWGRGIVSGVAGFANRHGPWHLSVETVGERRSLPHDWKGDGIIARISAPAVDKAVCRLSCPVVNVSGSGLKDRSRSLHG